MLKMDSLSWNLSCAKVMQTRYTALKKITGKHKAEFLPCYIVLMQFLIGSMVMIFYNQHAFTLLPFADFRLFHYLPFYI